MTNSDLLIFESFRMVGGGGFLLTYLFSPTNCISSAAQMMLHSVHALRWCMYEWFYSSIDRLLLKVCVPLRRQARWKRLGKEPELSIHRAGALWNSWCATSLTLFAHTSHERPAGTTKRL